MAFAVTTTFTAGTLAKSSEVNQNFDDVEDQLNNNIAPIGSVMAWLKTYTNTPALPSGWVECSGQTLSDADSVYNGQVIPDLNGNNNFLRGNSTSGSTGGSLTHNHIWFAANGLDGNSYTSAGASETIAGRDTDVGNNLKRGVVTGTTDPDGGETTRQLTTTRYTNKINSEPPYYDVVMIMRVK